MIEVFKTNVQEICQAEKMVALLLQYFPGSKINFDLQDCDKILRMEHTEICPDTIIRVIQAHGFKCGVLE